MRYQPLYKEVATWVVRRRLVRQLVEAGPGRRLSLRYVAGERLEDAIRAARELDARGLAVMLNYLGEHVESLDQAAGVTEAYLRALDGARGSGLDDVALALKLTQLGLDLDTGACVENAGRVAAAASALGSLVEIDMEHHVYVDRTLECYRELRRRHRRVGVCIQAYLFRAEEDIRRLAAEGAVVRLVKGGQLQPRSVAFSRRREVDESYRRLTRLLVEAGCEVHFATHNDELIRWLKGYLEAERVPGDRFEFQMLYGVRRDLQRQLADEGFRVRVYLPYGSDWYPYLSRRLAERPDNLVFFLWSLRRG